MANFRLLHLVMFASFCLLLLKGSALIFSDLSVLTGAGQLSAQEATKEATEEAAEEAANQGTSEKKDSEKAGAETLSADAENGELAPAPEKSLAETALDEVKAEEAKAAAAKAELAKAGAENQLAGPPVKLAANDAGDQKARRKPDGMRPSNFQEFKVSPSGSELDLLESLALRRKQLNDREAQLKMKENLLVAAQRQIDERIEKLKELEAKIQVDLKKQDVLRKNQYQRLVKMYSSMKPKDAARIFDGLNMGILVDLLRAMKATSGSQIVAKMNAEKARAVTMLLAEKERLVAVQRDEADDGSLPKIAGDKPAAGNQ